MISPYMRLRQVCLAAPQLGAAEAALRAILDIEVCHRSQLAEEFGLENAVFAVNGSFIEIVAPLREGTAVGRFLERQNGCGGYIVIVDCDDLAARRTAAGREGVRIAHQAQRTRASYIQLHPRDMGAAMLEIDHHVGGEDRFGYFEWGGDDWRQSVRTDITVDLLGVEFASTQPQRLAARWGAVLDRQVRHETTGGMRIELDYGLLRFASHTDEGELMSALSLSVRSPSDVLSRAAAQGCRIVANAFEFCGVRFSLMTAP